MIRFGKVVRARDAGCARAATHGAWWSWRRTWWSMYFQQWQYGSGWWYFRSACATFWTAMQTA